jgi:hypothetical protein
LMFLILTRAGLREPRDQQWVPVSLHSPTALVLDAWQERILEWTLELSAI